MKKILFTVITLSSLFVLSACSGGGTSSSSSTTMSVPPVPTSVAAACGNQKITVSWAAAPGATSYNVYRSTTVGTAGSLVGNSATTS